MLTRSGVAKRLGKSIATVRRMENVELHPVRDARGVLRFAEDEVDRVARSHATPATRAHRVSPELRIAPEYEAELEKRGLEIEELERRVAQRAAEQDTERARFARELQEAEQRTVDARRLADERERAALAAQRSDDEHFAAVEARERLALRHEAAELLESMSPRQLRRMDPADVHELLTFISDED